MAAQQCLVLGRGHEFIAALAGCPIHFTFFVKWVGIVRLKPSEKHKRSFEICGLPLIAIKNHDDRGTASHNLW